MALCFIVLFIPNYVHASLAWSNAAWGTINVSNILSDAEGENSTFAVDLNTYSGTFPSSGEFLVQVYSSSCTSYINCSAREIVRVKAVSGTGPYTLTIKARNQEGTTHSGNWGSGSKVTHAFTAGAFSEFGYSMALTDDSIWVGSSTSKPAEVALPTSGTNGCAGTSDKLLYNTATNAFSCGTDQDTGGATGYSTVEYGGTPLTQRSNLNFVGAAMTCADNSGDAQTDCTIDTDINTIAGLSCSQYQIINKGASAWQCGANPYDASSITTGTLSDSRLSSTVTNQGDTFNGASQLVQLNSSAQYPALDGSLITNLPSGFTNPMTTRGDIIYRNSSNVTARFPLCAANEYVGSDGTDLTCMAAGSASSISGVSDTTDSTSYVALFESATGTLAPKTDAGITYNASTGMLTATGLTGPLTGTASGNPTGTGTGAYYLPVWTSTTALGSLSSKGTANQPLLSGGTSANPSWAAYTLASPSTSGNIMKSDGTNWTSSNTLSVSALDLGSATLEIPNSTSLPVTCTVGQIYMDTDATSGQRIYGCESTNSWVLQGGTGGGSGTIETGADNALAYYNGAGTTINDSPITINETTGEITIPKQSGVSGKLLLYESNSTDTNGMGWQGPTSRSSDLYLKLPDADPSGGQYLSCATPSVGVSSCTWASAGSVSSVTGANGETFANGTDGKWTFTGVGGSNNEDLTIDLESTANTVTLGTSTGVTMISTGSIAFQSAVNINSDANGMTSGEMTTAGMYGTMFFATGAGTWNLPGAVAGMSFCIYSTTAAAVVVNPDNSDYIVLNGTALSAGDSITSASGAGDFICLVAKDATYWYTLGRSGTWSDTN
jgi:hypothetical protein